MVIRGWVYIITNKAMPGLLKIGYSTKDPELRAAELANTGSPHGYFVEYDALINDPHSVEQKIHKSLARKHEGKEWFRCEVDEAILEIRRLFEKSIILEKNNRKSSFNCTITSLKKEILVIGYPGEIGLFIAESLRCEGFNISLNESMEYEAPFTNIFAQLSEKQYDMVIVTYWAYYRVLPELRQRLPKVKIMFLNSSNSELDMFAQQYGVHDILRAPIEWNELLSRIIKAFSI